MTFTLRLWRNFSRRRDDPTAHSMTGETLYGPRVRACGCFETAKNRIFDLCRLFLSKRPKEMPRISSTLCLVRTVVSSIAVLRTVLASIPSSAVKSLAGNSVLAWWGEFWEPLRRLARHQRLGRRRQQSVWHNAASSCFARDCEGNCAGPCRADSQSFSPPGCTPMRPEFCFAPATKWN